jgi:hypothetical protein
MNLSRLFVLDGRLRSGWRVSLYLIGYVLVALVTQIPLVVLYVGYLMLNGASDVTDVLAAVRPEALPLWFYLALKLAEIALLLPMTYAFRRWLDRRDFAGLGFCRPRGWMGDLALGLGLGGVQMAFIFAVEWAGGWLEVDLLGGAALLRGLGAGALAAALFLLVALGEELIFRGYLLVNLRQGTGTVLAVGFSSILFGLFHALNPNFNLLALVNITLAGLVFAYAWLVTGNLWLPMAYHFSWNFFQGPIFSLPVSGARYGGLLEVVEGGGAALITGGAFGPEGGLIGTVALLSAFPVLWAWGRRKRTPEMEQT